VTDPARPSGPAPAPGAAAAGQQAGLLADVLADREARSARRAELAARWASSGRPVAVVQLSLAAPGPVKSDAEIQLAVSLGARSWEDRAAALGLPLLHSEAREGASGPCRLWVVDADARETKSLIIGLEEGSSLGRLWDFDVYDESARHVGRETLGAPARRCYLCGEAAAVCAGRRVHALDAVERRFRELLRAGIADRNARSLGSGAGSEAGEGRPADAP
jgi:holo-ACP synthase CitX